MSTATAKFIGEGRTVACPKCGADLYKHCRTPTGAQRTKAHATRVAEAERRRFKG